MSQGDRSALLFTLDEFDDGINMAVLTGRTVTCQVPCCTETNNLLFSEQRKGVQLEELNRSFPPIDCDAERIAKLSTKGPVATAIQVLR